MRFATNAAGLGLHDFGASVLNACGKLGKILVLELDSGLALGDDRDDGHSAVTTDHRAVD